MTTHGTFLALLTALALTAPAAYAEDSSSSSSSNSSSTNSRTTTRNSSSDTNRNSSSNSNRRDDQDDARDALRRGRVMPLTAILEIAFKRERGTVLDVDLETDDGVLVYEIELLSERGRKVEIRINARSGEILKVRYP